MYTTVVLFFDMDASLLMPSQVARGWAFLFPESSLRCMAGPLESRPIPVPVAHFRSISKVAEVTHQRLKLATVSMLKLHILQSDQQTKRPTA